MTQKDNEVREGLEGVVAFESTISHIDGAVPELVIRGYDINDIVGNLTFEQMSYLLLFEELPTANQLTGFDAELKSLRKVPKSVLAFLSSAPKNSQPMSVLRTAVSMLGCIDSELNLNDQDSVLIKLKSLIAKIPTIVAAQARINAGEIPLEPDLSLSHSSNYYYMVTGEVADEKTLNAFDAVLVIYAEHEINASTFACRVVMGTESDIYSSVVAGISAIKGPLHGGAIDGSMNMLKEIGSVENAENYVKDALVHKRKLPGFGHRVYRAGDPRAHVLKRMTLDLANSRNDSHWFDIALEAEKQMANLKSIIPNVDYYAAPLLYHIGFPVILMTNVVTSARIAGWSAHIMEQYGKNRLIRPRAKYTGKSGLKIDKP
ncbi:MAG: citrate synthase [Dehalococcoidia bacterium]|nr:citrate synthase [Dehalococcoidia bacterium]MQG16631.1 citrate synthase [SAR202 cluster bacterium]|tara:strand:- start:6131 stop:7255 length:1125 start_codon:yes stop_codon:yes gene_type:complete